MDNFFPFIHETKKKRDEELQHLYIELEPPLHQEEEEKEMEPKVVVIEL